MFYLNTKANKIISQIAKQIQCYIKIIHHAKEELTSKMFKKSV